MQALLGFMLAMTVTMVLIPLLMRWSVALGVQDRPEPRKVHKVPVPRVGGIAMAAGVLLALLIWGAPSRAMQALLIGIGVLMFFGVWDDRASLPAGPKFAGQAIAALVAMLWGAIGLSTITVVERTAVPVFVAMPLTFFFMVGGTNAFNLADGLDGLAGGMAIVCLAGTGLLAYTVGNSAVGTASVVIVGALIGFLRFNTYPARVFMGDSGSQLLGFSAAALTLLLTQDPLIPLSSALPLLLLGMPIIDTLMVMSERVMEGHSPFLADRRHIHHRLLALGFDHREAVCILYTLQGVLLVLAWFLRYAPDVTVALTFAGFSLLVISAVRISQRFGLRFRVGRQDSRAGDAEPVKGARRWQRSLTAVSGVIVVAALVVYGCWVLVVGAPLTPQERLLALVLAIILVAGFALHRSYGDLRWTDKLALYPAATLAVFLTRVRADAAAGFWLGKVDLVLFPILAVAMFLSIQGAGERKFKITPLDLLVLLLVLTIPNLPDSVASARSLGVSVMELVVLLYTLEAVSFMTARRWAWLSGATAMFLIGLVARGLL